MKNKKNYDFNEKMNVKTLRLKDSLSSLVYEVSKEKNLTESEYIRSLIKKDVFEFKLNKAIELYKNKEINISKGAEISGISYREFLTKLKEKNIPLNLDTMPLDYGIKSIKKSLNKK